MIIDSTLICSMIYFKLINNCFAIVIVIVTIIVIVTSIVIVIVTIIVFMQYAWTLMDCDN